jgi:hypothetical protein
MSASDGTRSAPPQPLDVALQANQLSRVGKINIWGIQMLYSKRPWKQFCRFVTTFAALVAITVASVGPAGAASAKTVELTDIGYLSLDVSEGPNNTKVAKISKAEPYMVGGGKGSMGMQPMYPQCPSAGAALWAWWGTNIAFCGAMGFFGPMAALGCSAAMAVAGSFIDFNKGC